MRRSTNRHLGRWAVALFLLSAVIFSTPASSFLHSDAGATSAACPGGVSQCTTVTIPCGQSTCPTVTVGPTENVGVGQFVYLEMTNFSPSDSVRVAYCPISNPPAVVSGGDPNCAYGVQPDQQDVKPIDVPVTSDGSVGASYPTEYDPSGESNTPIAADPIISPGPAPAPFFCDNGPDHCGIEVEDLPYGDTGTPESATNTALIPITFASSEDGCPKSDLVVSTESAYSVEHFLPAAVDSTCAQSAGSGVAVLNVANNTDQVVQDFTRGDTQIAFTDEPQNTTQQSSLGTDVEYIPIAASATVIAFLAGDYQSSDSQAFPVSTYNLTPNMVAGLITSGYSQGYGNDVLMPPLVCKQIYKCGHSTSADNYDSFDLLNPVAAGDVGPSAFGMFFSSTGSGSSYQVTNWLCSAPNTPFKVTVPLLVGGKPQETAVTVTDRNVADKTLTTPPAAGIAWPPVGDPTATWPYTSCSPYSDLPVLAGSTAQYSFDSSPALQAYRIRSYAFNGQADPAGMLHTLAGFGAMDWSEASFYGLDSANIQNPAGAFVGPSVAGIDAALADATEGPDGILQYNYDDTNADAYPMPLVTYAVVSTKPTNAATSQAEGDLLTNLVCYSHTGTGSVALPTGYVPLPDNLYSQAMQEIQKAFPYVEPTCNGKNPALPAGSTTRTSTGPGNTATNTTTGVGGVPGSQSPSSGGGSTGSGGGGSGSTSASNGLGTAKTGSASGGSGSSPAVASRIPAKGFAPVIFAFAEGTERWLLAGLGGLSLVGLIVGPLIILGPRARRRLRRSPARG